MPKKYNPPWYSGRLIYSYADNDASSYNMHLERKKYEIFVFPQTRALSSFDFWGKDKYYGRLDTYGSPISPRESYLKQLRFAEGPLFALNFVADAWRDLSEKIRELINSGVLINSGPYSEPLALKAWTSIENQYHEYMTDDIFNTFNDIYMSLASRDRHLKDVDTFLDLFYDYFDNVVKQAGPLTLSAFMESTHGSPLNTGLAIEISDELHSNDLAKGKDFIYDKNFQLISNLASNYGFSMDRNAPWRFVADLTSPVMMEYMIGVSPLYKDGSQPLNAADCGDTIINDPSSGDYYGFSNVPGLEGVRRHALGYPPFRKAFETQQSDPLAVLEIVFDIAYRQLWVYDVDILKQYLVDIYNRFVSGRSFIISYDEARRACEIKNNITIRDAVDFSIFDRTKSGSPYSSKWNLKTYYILRSLERGINDSIKKRIIDIQRIFTYYDFGLTGGDNYSKYINALRMVHEKMIGPPSAKMSGDNSAEMFDDGIPIKTLADY